MRQEFSETHRLAFTAYQARGYRVEELREDQLEALREDPNFAGEVAAERLRRAKDAAPRAATSAPTDGTAAVTKGFLTATLKRLAPSIVKAIEVTCEPLHKRIGDLERKVAALEARPELKYEGTHDASKMYQRGALVTHDGSLWFATSDVQGGRPGTGDAWKLVTKRGKDGKDLR